MVLPEGERWEQKEGRRGGHVLGVRNAGVMRLELDDGSSFKAFTPLVYKESSSDGAEADWVR